MTAHYFVDDVEIDARHIKIGEEGLAEKANHGEMGISKVTIRDPQGELNLVGWHRFHVTEDACSKPRTFTGRFYGRTVTEDEPFDGVGRKWEVEVNDLNLYLKRRVLNAEDANRPAEDADTRTAWLLTSEALAGLVFDTGYVHTGGSGPFDETDHRGQYALDVLGNMAPVVVRQYYVFYDEDADEGEEVAFFWDSPTAEVRDAGLRISNDPADQDGSTVFPIEASVQRDPSEVYGAVRYEWRGGVLFVTRQATIDAFDGQRDAAYSTDRIGRLATAQANAASWLEVRASETDEIELDLELDADQVNLILAGERAQVKLTWAPGYSDFVWTRVVERSGITRLADDRYAVHLRLTNRTPAGAPGGGSPGGLPWQCSSGDPTHVQTKGDTADSVLAAGTWSISLDATPSAGNLLVLHVLTRDASQIDTHAVITSAGWTLLESEQVGSVACEAQIYYKASDGSDGTVNFLNDSGDTLDTVCMVLSEYRGISGVTLESPIGESEAGSNPGFIGPGFGGVDVDYSAGGPRLILHALYLAQDPPDPGSIDAGVNERAVVDSVGGGLDGARLYVGDQLIDASAAGGTSATAGYQNTGNGAYVVYAISLAGEGCAAPTPGQPVLGEAVGTGDGSTVNWTTDHPFADGSLKVYVDLLDQTAAVTAQDGEAGTFTLGFALKTGESLTVDYQGR